MARLGALASALVATLALPRCAQAARVRAAATLRAARSSPHAPPAEELTQPQAVTVVAYTDTPAAGPDAAWAADAALELHRQGLFAEDSQVAAFAHVAFGNSYYDSNMTCRRPQSSSSEVHSSEVRRRVLRLGQSYDAGEKVDTVPSTVDSRQSTVDRTLDNNH